jgi:hypothetical protein
MSRIRMPVIWRMISGKSVALRTPLPMTRGCAARDAA